MFVWDPTQQIDLQRNNQHKRDFYIFGKCVTFIIEDIMEELSNILSRPFYTQYNEFTEKMYKSNKNCTHKILKFHMNKRTLRQQRLIDVTHSKV